MFNNGLEYACGLHSFGVTMSASSKHGVAMYNAGCRCETCRSEMSAYRKGRRRRAAESVGGPVGSGLRIIRGEDQVADSVVGPVEAAVRAEIDALGSDRGGLKAAAVALARILDNPKAVSTQPAAAAKLADMLETLRKNTDGRKSRLASVRAMTSVKTG